MSRHLKYSEKVQNEIASFIKQGISNRDAASLSGISETTFYKWLSNDLDNPLTPGQKREFRESIKRAEVERKKTLTFRIIEASRKKWQAAAWYLERVYPKEFGKNRTNEDVAMKEQEPIIPQELKSIVRTSFREALKNSGESQQVSLSLKDKINIKEELKFN